MADYYFVGLGNPGDEYKDTRHNAGRIVLEEVLKRWSGEKEIDWEFDKKANALLYKVKKPKGLAMLPETFMNKSGLSVARYIKSKKAAENLIVFHDELDLPMGTVRIAFNKSAGGHRGLQSVIKAVGTEAFVRVRIGISPSDSKGRAKKPIGEEKVLKHILSKFKPEELKILKKLSTIVDEALLMLAKESREKAMSIYNSRT